jgi:ribosomal protein S10
MKTLNIKIESKNQISIKKFLKFFKETSNTNFKTIQKFFSKKEKKTFISILKSPHVNKSAQEQFEIRNHSAQITIQTNQPFKLLIVLKKIKINLFPDINIKLRLIFNKKVQKSFKQKFFNIDNFQPNQFSKIKNKKIIVETINFNSGSQILSLFDMYGM